MPELEDSAYWQRNFERNQAWLAPGQHVYNTALSPEQEAMFRGWVTQNNVLFDPNAGITDYDMRGFWLARQQNDPRAVESVNPNDQQVHRPDYWKTPYSATFSSESQWANPQLAPRWNGDLYQLPNGTVLWNDQTQTWVGPNAPWSKSPADLMKQGEAARGAVQDLRARFPLGAGAGP